MADTTKFSFTLSFLFLIILNLSSCQDVPATTSLNMDSVIYLQPGLALRITNPTDLDTFCFIGHEMDVIRALETVMIKVHLHPDLYNHFIGSTPEEVAEEYNLHHYSWRFSLLDSKDNALQINPFNQTCVGVHLHKKQVYKVELIVIRVDYWRALMAATGVLLFVAAGKLSGNPLFYYLCGITAGISASFLILIYLFSKLLPKKPMMYGFVVGGWTVSIYFFQLLWSNFRTVLEHYFPYVVGYIASVGLLSFAFCYRFGPVSDPRSRNLIKWTLQGAGLSLIVICSWFTELMLSFCFVLVVMYNIPSLWISRFKSFWKRRFPPRVKLLSEDQYHEQGVRETQKALEELRGYCSSPECNTWKTVLKIKNPVRFAEFMNGTSHLNDEEILAYESEPWRRSSPNRSDCEESDSDDDYEY